MDPPKRRVAIKSYRGELWTPALSAGEHDLSPGFQVWQALRISRDTVRVATQGILLGSVLAMLAAAAGFLPPLAGACLQEGIDVVVIANALRATTGSLHIPSPAP
jgi:hypothetical protein